MTPEAPARARRRVGRWIGAVAGAYGAAAGTALAAVGIVRDRTPVTYTLALVGFCWLVPSVPLALAALAARRWRAVALLAVPVVASTVLYGPLLLPGRGGGHADLRVATSNITHGQPVDGVVALVRRSAPDVLVLEEVTPAQAAQLQRRLTRYPHRVLTPLAADPGGGDGDVVLSRYPVTEVRPVTGLPAGARPSDLVTLDVGGRPLVVVPLHLASPCLGCGPRAAAQSPAGTTARAVRVRRAESRRYAALVRGLRAHHRAVVLAGDLNSSELNEPLRTLTGAGLVDVHAAVGHRPQLTRGPGPGVARVDAVLVSGLRPVADAEGARGASTHSPVVADLAWPAP